jgi:hypothetical protein
MYCKIIARDLRLVASRLYRMAVTRLRVTCRHYNAYQVLQYTSIKSIKYNLVLYHETELVPHKEFEEIIRESDFTPDSYYY